MAVYKDKNGTWYVSARYTNWKGEADRKLKRGFVIEVFRGFGFEYSHEGVQSTNLSLNFLDDPSPLLITLLKHSIGAVYGLVKCLR